MHYEFTGKKPSKAQVKAQLARLIEANPTECAVFWGENWIEAVRIGKESGHYIGTGWIRELSGQDIVQELMEGARK